MTIDDFIGLSIKEKQEMKSLALEGLWEESLIIERYEALGLAFAQCFNLKLLNMEHGCLGTYDGNNVVLLGNAIAQCPCLETLNLTSNNLSFLKEENASALKSFFVQACVGIKTVDLQNNGLNELSVSILMQLENTLPSVEELYLSVDCFYDAPRNYLDALAKVAPNAKVIIMAPAPGATVTNFSEVPVSGEGIVTADTYNRIMYFQSKSNHVLEEKIDVDFDFRDDEELLASSGWEKSDRYYSLSDLSLRDFADFRNGRPSSDSDEDNDIKDNSIYVKLS